MGTLNNIENKVCRAEEVRNELEGSIVFTNGCFDLIHTGHVTYLANAADLGDNLVIGLNSDASVKRLKGESRPIKDQLNRLLVLASFEFVSRVVLFEEDTPLELIKTVRPDILVKGGDYDPLIIDPSHSNYIVGSEFVQSYGGTVKVIPFVEGYSSTNLIRKIRQ